MQDIRGPLFMSCYIALAKRGVAVMSCQGTPILSSSIDK